MASLPAHSGSPGVEFWSSSLKAWLPAKVDAARGGLVHVRFRGTDGAKYCKDIPAGSAGSLLRNSCAGSDLVLPAPSGSPGVEVWSSSFKAWLPAKLIAARGGVVHVSFRGTDGARYGKVIPAGSAGSLLRKSCAGSDLVTAGYAAKDTLRFKEMFDFDDGSWAGCGSMHVYRSLLSFAAWGGAPPSYLQSRVYRNAAASMVNMGWCDRRRQESDPNIMSPSQTPLHLAARNENCGAAKWLLGLGASPDLSDAHGRTPLGLAAKSERSQLIEVLMPHSAASAYLPKLNLGYAEVLFMRKLGKAGRASGFSELAIGLMQLTDPLLEYIGGFLRVVDELFCEAVWALVAKHSSLRIPALSTLADGSMHTTAAAELLDGGFSGGVHYE